MTAPAPSVTLLPCPFCGGEADFSDKRPNRRTYIACAACSASTKVGNNELAAAATWNTRATLSHARERIARIIDPEAWAVMDSYLEQTKRKYRGQNVGWPEDQFKDKASLAKADAIIAAGLVRDEAAIRADEREWCAKELEVSYPDNINTNAFCAAIRAATIRRGE